MITRVTLTLEDSDVELLDRLAALEGSNRSEVMRMFLAEVRPMVRQTVEVLEAALRQKDELMSAVTRANVSQLSELLPELERVQNMAIGSMARLEGSIAAQAALDPRPSNHGGHTPNPSPKKGNPPRTNRGRR